jgi:hypothetical protein
MEDKVLIAKKTPIGTTILMCRKERWTMVKSHVKWWTEEEAERILAKHYRERPFLTREVPPQYL